MWQAGALTLSYTPSSVEMISGWGVDYEGRSFDTALGAREKDLNEVPVWFIREDIPQNSWNNGDISEERV